MNEGVQAGGLSQGIQNGMKLGKLMRDLIQVNGVRANSDQQTQTPPAQIHDFSTPIADAPVAQQPIAPAMPQDTNALPAMNSSMNTQQVEAPRQATWHDGISLEG